MTEPTDADIEAMAAHPLHAVWTSAVDTVTSPDFRRPDGELDETVYVRRALRVMRQAEAEFRAELAAQLGRCAANARLNAERHTAGTPDRIALIGEMRAYEWAARTIERPER